MPESIQKSAFDPAFLAKNVLAIFEQMDESIPNAIVLDPVQSELYDLLEGIEDDLYRIIGMASYRSSMVGQKLVPDEMELESND